jgi:rubrerythrin
MMLEERGHDFYESLASVCSDPKVANLCADLAKAEGKHYKFFQSLRSGLAAEGKTMLLSDGQAARDRQIIGKSILPATEVASGVALGGSLHDAVAMAIQMEQDSVRFYMNLAETLPDELTLRQIIVEEQSHVKRLQALKV